MPTYRKLIDPNKFIEQTRWRCKRCGTSVIRKDNKGNLDYAYEYAWPCVKCYDKGVYHYVGDDM